MKTEAMLEHIQRESFGYFLHECTSENCLVPDSTHPGSPSSIAACGLALASYPVGVERGFLKRGDARGLTLRLLRFLRTTGHKGFYFHFLDRHTGQRAWRSELSTIDSTLLFAGMLTAAQYFGGEIRQRADELFARADWRWARNDKQTISHGWRPKRGFLRYRWTGYNEGLLAYILAVGSPTHRLPSSSYHAWTETYRWRKIYGREYLFANALFIHQLPHVWIDFRTIQDAYMRNHSIDYFENSRRATYAQRDYAIHNPKGFREYDGTCWGFTATDGPGPVVRKVNGRRRKFYGYRARGVPFGPDDGTIAPWAAVTSLPFAPEIVLPVIERFRELELHMKLRRYGFVSSYNPTFPGKWHSRWHFALNQGPLVLMIENFRSGLIWQLMRECPVIVRGLRRAGFSGGWLG